MTARYIVGDALATLRGMPDASVDLVLSSPPFLALRSYLPPNDPNKAAEMGSESTPGEFLDRLLDVVEECRRVLAPHGSLVLELGDSYAGSGGAGGDYGADGLREGQPAFNGTARAARLNPRNDKVELAGLGIIGPTSGELMRKQPNAWPLQKSLVMVPELLRVALAYGFNPLTGRPTPRWRVRNVVRWIRPNPPVGALADKFRPATTDFVVACVGRRRWFDMEAVRRPSQYDRPNLAGRGSRRHDAEVPGQRRNMSDHTVNDGGAPPLDWFEAEEFPEALKVTAGGYRGAHYAVFPEKVAAPFIEAMCPRRVCMECGVPSVRIVKPKDGYAELLGKSWADRDTGRPKSITGARTNHAGQPIGVPHIKGAEYETTGWTDCGHNSWRRGLVLDPFAGTGTVLMVAHLRGRDSVGIDLDPRNAELAQERFSLFPLEVQ